ncbi:MAG: acetyl/propionyl/methylcrotonyl-CoA carboxylase subunit alpha [Gaiellales bacterium]|jgi:acetyl-CoA carboxylase biotin carboxylase subunit|nr:acetyl-CoA carboxylase biotin carboxylase subunit [Gaiellales bacterium]
MLERVLIANRGEAAVRLVRACHDLGIEAVAVYSTADRDGLWVQLADRAVCVGPHLAADSYLNVRNLIGAAETTGCDAVHPGWGFLAENAAFVRACQDNDLVFVGPGPEAIELMGDKSMAKRTMRDAGVPLVPGSTDRLDGAAAARSLADEVGYPVLLKAAAGGGGRGMRLVTDPGELEEAYRTASAEALSAFGDGGMYLEKAIIEPRHVEMQVLADAAGAVLVLGERDCSIQRRHQKLIEEGPSPALDAATREAMAGAATRACHACGYVNAGTVEFLVDADGGFSFIEMNTRLQVEHPVSELLTGVDIACQQLLIAGGAALPAVGLAPLRGHAIEFRLNCEDPRRGFLPAAGTVTRLRPPLGPGVRFDTHAYEGYRVPPFYDSMLAKLIVHGEDRRQALARSRRALSELEIEGVATTRELFLEILEEPDFQAGRTTTAYLDHARERLPSLASQPVPA